MGGLEKQIETAGLLHDIGKVCIRAEQGKITHSKAGCDFLQKYMNEDATDILRAVAYHHAAALKNAVLADDSISYIIYEADNIAASSERRSNETGDYGFSAKTALESVFNVLKLDKHGRGNDVFRLRSFGKDRKMQYPVKKEAIQADSSEYKKIMSSIADNFQIKSPQCMEINELLKILEATMSYIPSSTAVGESADISLFDHQKLTAAIAVCMYKYFSERGIRNYKAVCYGNKQAEMRQKNVYLIASGDISGIQNFIYTIPSKGALKSLRGRSFYLEILLENIVDELLSAVGLSRTCLIYTGGGHFYVLLPNTDEMKGFLPAFKTRINNWFMDNYGTGLYMAMAWTECSAADFGSGAGGVGRVYRRVIRKLQEDNLCRYDTVQLKELFSSESKINQGSADGRECAVCHRSSGVLREYSADDNEAVMACPACCGLKALGERLVKNDVIIVSKAPSGNAVPLPGWRSDLYLQVCSEEQAANKAKLMERLYVKNQFYTGQQLATYLWMGDYSIKDDAGNLLEFADMAEFCGGERDAAGIKRLGVMRADIDNLGATFSAGFTSEYDTLSRSAALSRQLSLFFKYYINAICRGELNGVNEENKKPFSLFKRRKNPSRIAAIVYSGGDDMFIVGAWDEIIELAVDIRRAFAVFTDGRLTFSAGIGFFDERCPVSQMARKTGELEDYAKKRPDKDSIALFGSSGNTARYGWDDFEKKVCMEKLSFLQSCFVFTEEEKKAYPAKIFMGKSGMYRLLELIRDTGSHNINIARFAYTLARIEPLDKKSPAMAAYSQIRQRLYQWYRNEADRCQLATALELVIYSIREKSDK